MKKFLTNLALYPLRYGYAYKYMKLCYKFGEFAKNSKFWILWAVLSVAFGLAIFFYAVPLPFFRDKSQSYPNYIVIFYALFTLFLVWLTGSVWIWLSPLWYRYSSFYLPFHIKNNAWIF